MTDLKACRETTLRPATVIKQVGDFHSVYDRRDEGSVQKGCRSVVGGLVQLFLHLAIIRRNVLPRSGLPVRSLHPIVHVFPASRPLMTCTREPNHTRPHIATE